MKKVYLFTIMCLLGVMVSQRVSAAATVSVSDGVLTIKTDKAGDLKQYMESASDDQKAAIRNSSTIVFDGKFNKSDLDALNGAGCCTQSTVDMSKAKFVKSGSLSGLYTLYHNTPSNSEEGKTYLIGATKYIGQPDGLSLQEINEGDNPNPGNWQTYNILPEERDAVTIYSAGSYIKLPTTLNYYQKVNGQWTLIESPTSNQISSAIEAQNQYTTSNMPDIGGYAENSIIKIRSADCTSFKYYVSIASFKWDDAVSHNQDYNDGGETTLWYPDGIESAPKPTGYNSVAYTNGSLKVYSNGQWSDPSQAGGDEEYDYTQMKFDYWKDTVEEIITSEYATGPLADQLCNDCSKLKTLTLSAGDFASSGTVLGNNINSLEAVNIQNDVTSLSAGMFNGAGTIPNQDPPVQNLKTVTFEDGCQIKVLPTGVFRETGITNLAIPPSVEEIQGGAFSGCEYLTTVTIPENTSLKYIRTNAFQGCDNIEDVYVNVNPNTHPICCEYLAFGEYSLVGQTNESLETTKMATLHFNEDYWDYYAGNWKKGITFAQSQLDAIKDGCDPSADGAARINQSFCGNNYDLTNTYTNESNENIKRGWIEGKSPANGWQQFAKTSTGSDIIPKGKYFRTYSTDVPQVRPEWMHIYRITAFSDGFDPNNPNFNNPNSREQADAAEKKATAVEITEVNTGGYSLIPANTGMIRVDVVAEDALYYFMDFEDTGITYNTNWGYPYNEDLETANNQKLNYMYPTGEEDRVIGPVERGDNGKIRYRIFGLLKKPIEGTNRLTGQFSRAKNPTTLAKNRAYLKLPAALFHWTNESTGSSQNATDDATPSQYGKISLFFDDDFEEVNGGVATEIINAIEEDMYKNDSFYTIQGVKVAKPTTKGVYIHNGKKIFIK